MAVYLACGGECRKDRSFSFNCKGVEIPLDVDMCGATQNQLR